MTRKSCGGGPIERNFRENRTSLLRIVGARAAGEEEDIVQDAYLRLVVRAQSQDITKLDNLLRHVVRCFAIDRFRRKATRQTFTSDTVGEDTVDAAADPERHVIGAQRLTRVMAAIEAMPPKRKEVFLLHRVEEQTYAQIARRLGISIKTVEKHMASAIRQLSDTDD